ncbi:MAG: prolyl oligopeptidase family serine peptidase, partial [Verrucomicrobia bacterium]|nr:prolyl oligopeptidase family serine peptidase [Verrucomicrobiota bacterium]
MFRAFASLVASVSVVMGSGMEYPYARKGTVVDDYFGTKVPDPYRWLEDVDSAETIAWVNAQNQLSSAYLQNSPERSRFKQLLTQLLDFERYSVPRWEGNRYIFRRNDGLQNQSVILTQNNLEDAPRVLLDPNQLSTDGTLAISDTAVSDDGSMMAYGEEQSGSDWNTIRVRDIESGLDLIDVVKWVKFSSASWTKDSKGFFYSRFPEPKQDEHFPKIKNQKLYYHRIGEPQKKDLLIYERPEDPELGFTGTVSHDGKFLILTVSKGTEDQELIYVKRLGDPGQPNVTNLFFPIEEVFEADFRIIGVIGDWLFVLTDLGAPLYRVVKIDLLKPERSNWTEIVREKSNLLSNAVLAGGKLLLVYQVDANDCLQIFDLDGQHERDISLPTLGSVSGLSGDPERPELFYAFTSYLYPTTIYQYDIDTGTSKVFKRPNVNFRAEDFGTKQLFCQSRDGTKVPLFVVAKKGLTLDGDNPVFLTGYGGFNISVTPSYLPMYLAWLKEGGVVVQVNLRGGGEYGRTWHEAGTRARKQNVFDDFIAAAEMLIDSKYTRPARI